MLDNAMLKVVHNLFRDWLDDPDFFRAYPRSRDKGEKGTMARMALADILNEQGHDKQAEGLRRNPVLDNFVRAFNVLFPMVGRAKYGNSLKRMVEELAHAASFLRRHYRLRPEGRLVREDGTLVPQMELQDGSRLEVEYNPAECPVWVPTAREDAHEVIGLVKPPNRVRHHAYCVSCRTLRHCRWLVWRALFGYEVPDDIRHFETGQDRPGSHNHGRALGTGQMDTGLPASFVTADPSREPMVIMDGNHRGMFSDQRIAELARIEVVFLPVIRTKHRIELPGTST